MRHVFKRGAKGLDVAAYRRRTALWMSKRREILREILVKLENEEMVDWEPVVLTKHTSLKGDTSFRK
jgi:hypothetical protein